MDISYDWMLHLEAISLLCTKNPAPKVLSLVTNTLRAIFRQVTHPLPHTGKDKFTQEATT